MQNSFYSPRIVGACVSLCVWSTNYSMLKYLDPIDSPALCQHLLLVINRNLEKEFGLVGIKK